MRQYAGMPPVKQDAELTDRECHLYPDRFFVSTLPDRFVLAEENSVNILRDPPHSEDKIHLTRRTPGKQTGFCQCSTAVMVSPAVSLSRYFTSNRTAKYNHTSS